MLAYLEVNKSVWTEIYKLYGKNPQTLCEDVKSLKEWMETQKHLPQVLDNKLLENFLISNKFSVERSKRSIDMYYTLRTKLPQYFYFDLNQIKKAMEITYQLVLPKMTQNNYRVFVFKIKKPELLEELSVEVFIQIGVFIEEIRLREDVMFGEICIFDIKNVTFDWCMRFTPTVLTRILKIYEKMFSIPLKKVYVINCPSFISYFMELLKPFVKPKIFNRMVFVPDSRIINKEICSKILPRDYGGEELYLQELNDKMYMKLEEYRDEFISMNNLYVDERLREDKLENDEILGFYGNFQQLAFD